jgi:hypothetical protein
MASRDYIKHTVTTTAPVGAQAGDEYYNPTTNVLYKDLVANGSSPGFNQVVFVNNSSVAVVSGAVSATGNVTGNYIISSGSGGSISGTGNITGGNLLTGGLISATANVTGGNINTGGIVSAVGNIVSSTATANISAAGNVVAGGNIFDGIGPVRNIPINTQAANYTLALSDNGKFVSTNSQLNIPNTIFSAGNAITLFNNSAANISIAAITGTTVFLAGTGSTGNRTLTQRGLATLLCVSANTFVISGAGLV